MFLLIISYILPIIISSSFTYYVFLPFYGASSPLVGLVLLSAFLAVVISIFLPLYLRVLFSVIPFFITYCLLFNFLISLFIIAVFLVLILALRRSGSKSKALFTDDNKVVIVKFRTKKPLFRVFSRVLPVFSALFTVIFILTFNLTVTGFVWGVRAFPVDFSQKPLYGEYANPSGEITCCVGYDSASVVVSGFTLVDTDYGQPADPAREAGLKEGDVILSFNGEPAKMSEFLTKGSDGSPVTVKILRFSSQSEQTLTFNISPVYSPTYSKYMIGIIYFQDQLPPIYSSVQTVSFTYPETGAFAATAHGADTDFDNWDYYIHALKSANVTGQDNGGITASPGDDIGNVLHITKYGFFGNWTHGGNQTMPIASKSDLRLGKATILTSFQGGSPAEYSIFITGTYRIDFRDVICFKVIDERLISSGGIVRGMSGSPILQNGKIIGALSNTDNMYNISYATFACDMAHEMYKLLN